MSVQMRYFKRTLTTLVAGASLGLVSGIPAFAASGGSPASGWHIGYYQNTAPSPSNAAAPTSSSGIASLNFTNQANTSLLVTSQKAQFGDVLGDLTGKTITANLTISGATGAFTYYGEGTPSNPCVLTPANARLYFETSNAGGFAYTHYWWSNPASVTLANGNFTITAKVEPDEWSDWNGQFGNTVSDGFAAAASNVTEVGLSFGGGCFFENGVGTTDGSGTLTLNSFSATS